MNEFLDRKLICGLKYDLEYAIDEIFPHTVRFTNLLRKNIAYAPSLGSKIREWLHLIDMTVSFATNSVDIIEVTLWDRKSKVDSS